MILWLAGCATSQESSPFQAIATDRASCPSAGSWLVPATGRLVTTRDIVTRLDDRRIVLLTELHDRPDHHRWQLQILSALHVRYPEIGVGFEMFPRGVQPALDRWAQGHLNEERFLREADWWTHWGFDPDLYLPLFHFARLNRLDMRALNVERPIVARVARDGLESVSAVDRRGVGDPAPLQRGYLEQLLEAYKQHLPAEQRDGVDLDHSGFQRFADAQALRDRAMAEALSDMIGKGAHPAVGIVGRGHADHGYGVPAQLLALGLNDVTVLTPWSLDEDCSLPQQDIADAVFLLADDSAGPPPKRLGVRVEAGERGLRVIEVGEGSAASRSGMEAGDVLLKAGGRDLTTVADLHVALWRSGPAGALPLTLERRGELREVFAQFP
jgi:uncharacterized iron-regulated protein